MFDWRFRQQTLCWEETSAFFTRLGGVGSWAPVWIPPFTSGISASWNNGSGPRSSCGLKAGSEMRFKADYWRCSDLGHRQLLWPPASASGWEKSSHDWDCRDFYSLSRFYPRVPPFWLEKSRWPWPGSPVGQVRVWNDALRGWKCLRCFTAKWRSECIIFLILSQELECYLNYVEQGKNNDIL